MIQPGVITRLLPGFAERTHRLFDEHPTVARIADVLLVLLTFVAFDAILQRVTRLSAEAYFAPFLLPGVFERLGWLPAIAIASGIVFLVIRRSLHRPWTAFEHGRLLRGFVVFIAAVLAWPLSTYGYNYYFDQAHLADRGLLLVFVPLLWWRPIFILPFVVLVWVILWQFGQPDLGGSIFPHKLQLLNVLELFLAFLVVRSVIGDGRSGGFVFLVGCMVASSYWLPALGKLEIGWLQHASLYLIPPAAYAHGWLSGISADAMAAFAAALEPFSLPAAFAVLVVEAAFLLFFWNYRLALLLLTAAILFHFGVFAIYGFFFWTWILLDAALILLLLRLGREATRTLFAAPMLAFSIVLIAAGGLWAHPPKLAWHDTRLNYAFQIYGVDSAGNELAISPDYFGPYQDSFTMMPFAYLVDEHATLVGSYGVTAATPMAEAINAARTADDIFRLEARAADRRYDEDRARVFYDFVQVFVAERQEQGPQLRWLAPFAAPPQFFGLRGSYPGPQDEIEEVVVREITTFFDGRAVRRIRETELARLPIASPGSAPVARE